MASKTRTAQAEEPTSDTTEVRAMTDPPAGQVMTSGGRVTVDAGGRPVISDGPEP